MKCHVCNKEFDGNECPRCKFPKVLIVGDYATGIAKIQPEIDAYKESFNKGIEIGIVIYHWKDEDGTVVLDREEKLSFGRGDELLGKTVWLKQKFARIPDEKKLQLRVYVKTPDDEREETVSINNLFEAELQELGICTDADYNFSLLLRNETGTPVSSEAKPIIVC